MKYIDEYRDKSLVLSIAQKIKESSHRQISLMEVCGGHTMAIRRFGIQSLLPDNIQLLSGPGCPVCVTATGYIDRAIAYARQPGVIVATYGDLIRVPGSTSTLDFEKASGCDIRIVISAMEALQLAKRHPGKRIIFLGIGFETTAPASAAAILGARRMQLDNFFLFSSHKVMPPAMEAIIDEGVALDGYIAPGHVSTVTGTSIYEDIPDKYRLGCVISGFEPVDLMESILMLVRQVEENRPAVEIQYRRAVRMEGNLEAKKLLEEVFELREDWWRGLGVLPDSGYKLRDKFSGFDAEKKIIVEVEATREPKGCICGEILKGQKRPPDCKLFARTCTPQSPIGACMVSHEGACQAYYQYRST